ncbi:MAG TPA: lysylphosphatidylglycerol synthase transmembrane domain-containing protein [Streptosporangiaceae bacterium]|jgi:undecaprenyl-diphosphatase
MTSGQPQRDSRTQRGGETAAATVAAVTGEPVPAGKQAALILPSSRYRHPGDVIRLITGGLVLIVAVVVAAVAPRELAGPGAASVTWLGSSLAAAVLVGLVQVAFAAAAVGIVAAALWHRRFRLLASLALAAALAGAVLAGILYLIGGPSPAAVAASTGRGSWLAGAAFPGPALLAGAVAVTVAASPWLSRPWRRAAWLALFAAGVARLLAGTALPMELVLALATGVTAGAGVLVALGVPDRRMGPAGVAAALRSAGLPVSSVARADVEAKGSRPFFADTDGGRRLFIKVLGSDQRDADLLYRAYRFARLRDVGDTRPAASLIQAVEHQALVALMAERAGVRCPRVDRVLKAPDGTALLVMDRIEGRPLAQLPAGQIGGNLLRRLWAEVARLHQAGIAHRSLRAANVVVGADGRPWLTDFSFAELSATQRQLSLDLAELLASLATLAGAEAAVGAAAAVVGARELAPAVPLLQPLALSAATRRAVAAQDGLLARTRSATAAASGSTSQQLARLQRVRPRTLLMIAALAGAFYLILPQLAQVSSSWHALLSAQWGWVPVVIAMSALTYLASAVSLLGGVPGRVPLWPTVLAQFASSFINRVSPANVGGMALNARYLQKAGVPPAGGVAAVGVNALVGAIAHVVLIVVFFILAGHQLGQAFKLPPASKLLLILAVLAAVVGIVLATRQGRRFAVARLLPGLRSAYASLARVAVSPVKLTLLFGGSVLVTLAYIGGLVASVHAFGGETPIATLGAVYLGAAAIAAASPTPGGLGAIEAALVAGLTGVGIEPGPAVSAVLTYRLATYWLPVLPGWISLQFLQRGDYL